MKTSAILVNYHSAALLAGAVASIQAQETPDEREIIVVDNSESDTEFAYLKSLLGSQVNLIRNPRNSGFAAACNTAFRQASGDAILLLNPDARLLPGALTALTRCLFASPETGAVGPLTFWDEGCRFMLPPSTFPSLPNHLRRAFAHLHPRLRLRHSGRFRQKALALWTARQPVQVEALSGGHVLLKRSAVDKAGGLFDERFFMYWEDSDLMQRLHGAGYHLYVVPQARALHHYDHHPGKDALMARGWAPYHERYIKGHWRARLSARFERHAHPFWPDTTNIPVTPGHPIRIDVPAALQAAWLLEVSPAPDFVPAMGCLGSGPLADIPAECWERFTQGRYYVRLAAASPRLRHFHCWSWNG